MNRIFALFACAAVLSFADPTSRDWYQAIRENRLADLKSMASSASALNVRDTRGTTPLMYAAAIGSAESLKMLLDAGADVNAKNGLDVTPLHFAGSDLVKVRLLVEAGANVNAVSKSGRTALITVSGTPASVETVKLLLSKGADPQVADRLQATALIQAAQANDSDTLRLLLSKAHDINGGDRLGFTPLFYAAGHGNLAAVKLLIEKGADVNRAIASDITVRNGKIAISNMTPLMTAPMSSPEVVQTLIKAGAKVNARDVRGMTPLMFAVASDNPNLEIIRALIDAGADKAIKSTDNELARDWALKYNDAEVVKLFGLSGSVTKPVMTPVSDKKRDLRESIAQSLTLLQSTGTEYFKQSGCVGCHHQPVVALAVERAARKGLPVDAGARAEQLRVVRTEFTSAKDNLFQGIFISADSLAFTMMHLIEAEYPADDLTDALVSAIASKQELDGSWNGLPVMRPPLEDSKWVRTAMAARALAKYPIPARRAEFEDRVAKARRWLTDTRPTVPYERTFQLLGLTWTNASSKAIQTSATEVRRMQQANGGWAQLETLSADAFATGAALYALAQSGVPPQDPTYRRGVDYLLATQHADGSWYVPSRSPKLQPYFQSGFPHNHDQWISSAATAFAAAALTEAVQPAQKSASLR